MVIIEDYQEAITDYTKAIEINPEFSDAYFNRGIAKIIIDEKEAGCSDLHKARDLGDEQANDEINEFCK